MKSNKELLKEFETHRQMSIEEWKDEINKRRLLKENNGDVQPIIVDDLDEYMKSLGFSALEKIKEEYNVQYNENTCSNPKFCK